MDWRALGKRLIAGLAILACLSVLYDGYRLLRAAQINRALATVRAGQPVDVADPRVSFARAYALQQDGRFDDTVKAYAEIDAGTNERLRSDVKYNLANLYLRRALQFEEEGADDLAVPLIELAKENYRELLRADSHDWSAKYNLELALRLAPETDPEEVDEEHDPEHNPRAAAGVQVRKPLP